MALNLLEQLPAPPRLSSEAIHAQAEVRRKEGGDGDGWRSMPQATGACFHLSRLIMSSSL